MEDHALMTKSISLLAAFALVIVTTGAAVAQTPATPPVDKQSQAATAKSLDGTVKSASADRVVVTGKEHGRDAERTFVIDAATTLKKSGKDITAADLKSGDAVQVRYVEADGKARADAITVQGPAKAKPRNPCAAVK
jgi:cytoskeletal protein RodZ